jgi:hypothetical protein
MQKKFQNFVFKLVFLDDKMKIRIGIKMPVKNVFPLKQITPMMLRQGGTFDWTYFNNSKVS